MEKMRLHKRTARLILIPVAAIALGVSGPRGTSSAATPMMTPMPMGHHTGPVSFMNDHQVAPAVTKMLMHASVKTCGHMVMGSGYVKMIPVHVGMMGTAPHVDLLVSVQAAGMMRLDVEELGVDALSLAAHKFYGPKGSGALYLRQGTAVAAQIVGGTQERERRAGTENVAGAIGLAAALQFAVDELEERTTHVRSLRDRLIEEIPRLIRSTMVTGPLDGERRLAGFAAAAAGRENPLGPAGRRSQRRQGGGRFREHGRQGSDGQLLARPDEGSEQGGDCRSEN